jgi:hypothetical protein
MLGFQGEKRRLATPLDPEKKARLPVLSDCTRMWPPGSA